MPDHAEDNDGDGDNIFVYRGGRAPLEITHALIDKSVYEIEAYAFKSCRNLLQVETHDGIRKIGKRAFHECVSLRRINLKSAVEIGENAFCNCVNLADVEFVDRLEIIGVSAFAGCISLKHLKLPSVITIGYCAFWSCTHLTDIELSGGLETIGTSAFLSCPRLKRIAIPLKRDLFVYDDIDGQYTQFSYCDQLTRVDLIGGIHDSVVSLHLESWRTEMIAEINRINQILPNTPCAGMADEIRQWMDSVIDKMDHYKADHRRYVREGITFLELALWKAKLGEKEEYAVETKPKKVKVDSADARKERRIICGADIVIKNVLPFLQLE